jgi:Holliday junction resolvase
MESQNTANEPAVPYGQPLDFQQVWLLLKETDRILTEKFQETDKKFQETEKLFKETDKKIRKLDQLFTSQWGKLVESLVEGDLIRLLNTKGIKVRRTSQRVKGNHEGKNFEYDIIAYNGEEIVIVEVKTTLRPDDVNDFHEKIWKSKVYLPEYANKIVYGAIAFITADGSSDCMAEKQGFFVIRATGSSSSIINQEDFKPKAF